MIDCTLVVGVDEKHLEQLKLSMETWYTNKPSLAQMPLVVFFDREQIKYNPLDHLPLKSVDALAVPWPPVGVKYPEGDGTKWRDPQREKMLSGFVHVPARFVNTEYWLKLDTDVVAVGNDYWIKDEWFDDIPDIVAHPWSFTKPANQMEVLDKWSEICIKNLPEFVDFLPLELHPLNPDADRLGHKRIISWCGFFNTVFTQLCSDMASRTCTTGRLPVPSQDGFMWYVSTRLRSSIRRVNMKALGWQHWSTFFNVKKACEEAMK